MGNLVRGGDDPRIQQPLAVAEPHAINTARIDAGLPNFEYVDNPLLRAHRYDHLPAPKHTNPRVIMTASCQRGREFAKRALDEMSAHDVDDFVRKIRHPAGYKESYNKGLTKLREIAEDPHNIPAGGWDDFCEDWHAMASELIRKRKESAKPSGNRASKDFEEAQAMVLNDCCPHLTHES